eukprot:XP_001691243.1 predicted protein [Chlamydomonas reinhardtii]
MTRLQAECCANAGASGPLTLTLTDAALTRGPCWRQAGRRLARPNPALWPLLFLLAFTASFTTAEAFTLQSLSVTGAPTAIGCGFYTLNYALCFLYTGELITAECPPARPYAAVMSCINKTTCSQDWRGAETNSKELCLVLIASVYGSYGAPRQPWGNSTLCDVRITAVAPRGDSAAAHMAQALPKELAMDNKWDNPDMYAPNDKEQAAPIPGTVPQPMQAPMPPQQANLAGMAVAAAGVGAATGAAAAAAAGAVAAHNSHPPPSDVNHAPSMRAGAPHLEPLSHPSMPPAAPPAAHLQQAPAGVGLEMARTDSDEDSLLGFRQDLKQETSAAAAPLPPPQVSRPPAGGREDLEDLDEDFAPPPPKKGGFF